MNEGAVVSSIVGIFLVVCILFESIVITAFGVVPFKRALLQAAIMNVASLLVVYALWPIISRMDIDEDKLFLLLPLLFVATLVIEGLLLKLLNRAQHVLRILGTVVLMNGVSFVVLYGLLLLL